MNVQEYAKSGKVSMSMTAGMLLATAEAGRAWGELAPEERTLENAQSIIREAPHRQDNRFFGKGEADMAEIFAADLGNREGANLVGYLDDISEAVKDVDFAQARKGVMPKNFQEIRSKFSQATKTHLNAAGTVADMNRDFLETIQKPQYAEELEDVSIEPKPLGGLLGVILQIIGALLGFDVGAMLGMGQQPNENEMAQRAAEANIAYVSQGTNEKLDRLIPAAAGLRDGKNIDENFATVKEVTGQFGGAVDDKAALNPEQAQALGEQLLDVAMGVRTGQVAEKDIGQRLSGTLAVAGAAQEQGLEESFPGLDDKSRAELQELMEKGGGVLAGIGNAVTWGALGTMTKPIANISAVIGTVTGAKGKQ